MPVIVPVMLVFLPLVVLATLQFVLPVLAPVLMPALDQPPERYGWMGGAMGLGSVWFLAVNASIAPVLGPVRTLGMGLGVAAAGLLCILSGIWLMAVVGAFLIGFGYATTTPAGSQILTDFTPRAKWGTLFSLRQSAVPVGGLIAGIAGTQLTARFGWPLVLELSALVCVYMALAFVMLPRRLNEFRPLQPLRSGGRFGPQFGAQFGVMFRPSNVTEPFRVVRATPGLMSLVAAGAGLSAVHGAVTSFFVLYLTVEHHLSLERAGALFGVLQTFGMLGRVVFGFVADKIGSPLPVLRIQAPMSALCALIMAGFSGDWPVTIQIATVALVGLSVGTWNGLYLAEIARLAPPGEVGRATAGAAFFGFSMYMIVPVLMGFGIVHLGFRASFVVVSLAAVAASVILAVRRVPAVAKAGAVVGRISEA